MRKAAKQGNVCVTKIELANRGGSSRTILRADPGCGGEDLATKKGRGEKHDRGRLTGREGITLSSKS